MGYSYTYVYVYCGRPELTSLSSQAGLLSGVLTAFVVPKIQDLKVDPTVQSVYYQNQSTQILDQISQQLASVGSQILTNSTPSMPSLLYPTFHASASDRRVNVYWLISLVCSLSAALLATLVQQWVRAYMRIFQQSSNPLKTARIRLFLFEGTGLLPAVAEAVPGLIHVSLILFLWGLCDIILQIDTAVFITTVVPIGICVCLYLFCVVVPIWNPQSPYRTPFSDPIWHLIQKLTHRLRHNLKPTSMEMLQEQSAMEVTGDRKKRDVRAVQWLVDNINGSNETEAFVLAIPGSFNQKWGREVWKGVVRDDQSTSTVDLQTQPHSGLPFPHEGTTVRNLSRGVQYLLKTYSSEGDFMDTKERRKRMRLCVETVASLVCCTDSTEVELGLFGEVEDVGKVLSELGDKERTNGLLTIRPNLSFTVRWTCLSLVAIWKMLDSDSVQEAARFALDGIPLYRTDYGGPDTMPLTAALRIDDYLTKAWTSVVDLHLALKPWRNRTESEIKEILNGPYASLAISELEHIANEADELRGVDWRISLLQETMDGATHQLIRRLPGVFFTELKTVAPIMIREAFDFSSFATTPVPPQSMSEASPIETTPVLPQLIFPGQQIQSLCSFGGKLRDIMEGQSTEKNEETLKSLESLHEIPVALRGLNYLMKRQLWRLMDLRDGGGLGFTIELFFLALRQFSPTPEPTPLSSELKDFHTGTFKVITSNWRTKNSVGTQQILLDLLCDLVIRSRGVFSNISYPLYAVDMLLDLVGEMVEGNIGSPDHINDVIQELVDIDAGNRVDNVLREKVLSILPQPTAGSGPAQAQVGD